MDLISTSINRLCAYSRSEDFVEDAFAELPAPETGEYATARLVKGSDSSQYITVRAVAFGQSGNGILVQVLTTGSSPAVWLDIDNPNQVRYRYKLSLTPTWEDLAAVINDSDYIELVSNTATGPITDVIQVTTAGGIDPDWPVGTFGVPVAPVELPVTLVTPQATTKNLIASSVNRLCEYSRSGDFIPDAFTDVVSVPETGEYATAKLVNSSDSTQFITVRAVAQGLSGNGILVQVLTTGSSPAVWLDIDNPHQVRYCYKLSLTPTWEDVAAVINDSDYIELVSNTATGPITDVIQVTTAGGIDPDWPVGTFGVPVSTIQLPVSPVTPQGTLIDLADRGVNRLCAFLRSQIVIDTGGLAVFDFAFDGGLG